MVVGEKYLDRLDAVMEKIEKIGYDMDRIVEGVFLFLGEKYPESIFNKTRRNHYSPAMVSLHYLKYFQCLFIHMVGFNSV